MPVQFRLFRLDSEEGSAELLNRFLRQHRTIRLEKHFVLTPEPHYEVLVEYDLGKPEPLHEKLGQVDFEKAQSGKSKEIYAALKEWRSKKAKSEGMPAFHIFKDADLDILAGMRQPDLKLIRAIPGFGPVRTEKWGPEILQIMQQILDIEPNNE